MRLKVMMLAAAAALTMSACHGPTGSTIPGTMAPNNGPLAIARPRVDTTSMLKALHRQLVIGSTVDPKNGDSNPYGLAVAQASIGNLHQGDLVVCNFNDRANVQGTGTTIEVLSPKLHSKPKRFAQSRALRGCAALALTPYLVWASAFGANSDTALDTTGAVYKTLKGAHFDRPFGNAFAEPPGGTYSNVAFFVSNAGNGTIVRVSPVASTSNYASTVVARGFAVNHGKPGSILGPSGLQYDAATDTLYIVDGTNDTVVAFSHAVAALTKTNGIIVQPSGKAFTGPQAADARLVYAGKPLNGPISAALLPNHNLVIGNTGNPNGKNLMVEMTPTGKVLDVRNVDKGIAGAIFGIVATGTNDATTKIYFNDDNANNLQVLER